VVEERGLTQVSDETELADVVDAILAQHAADAEEYRSGDDKVRKKKRGFFMGEAMKATRGQGNPQVLTRLLEERLDN
jgi:aspartyl-tRNA(Asn)/glutamyl-tRNA(Gln) amidotransferase subunit B